MAPAFFPLDEQLALVSGSLTPTQEEALVRLASWMPFRRAAQMLEALLGVQVSEATVRRHTQQVGVVCQQLQDSARQQEQAEGMSQPATEPLVFSVDGAYVPLLKGAWAEVRTLVIGTLQGADGEGPAKTKQLSYYSRMSDAESFAALAEGEMQRRAVTQAAQVCAVTDGAEWIQGFIDLHRPDAVRILDFPHAAQRLGRIAELCTQAGHWLPPEWLSQQCHRLKHEGGEAVLTTLQAVAEVQGVGEHHQYLHKRAAHLRYPDYQAAGLPIGSGIVESGNKVVMQARLKGAGMHWQASHVNPMLALRTLVCNDRWQEGWSASLRRRLVLRLNRRHKKARPRLLHLLQPILWLATCLRPLRPLQAVKVTPASPPSLPRPASPPATLPGSCRPSASHPWKKSGCFSRSLRSAKN